MFIKKIISSILILILCLTINIETLSKNKIEAKAITTFEEYEEELKKIDYIIVIVAPTIIIGIGTIVYFKRNKRL